MAITAMGFALGNSIWINDMEKTGKITISLPLIAFKPELEDKLTGSYSNNARDYRNSVPK
jgi:hypothetical protein